MGRVIYLDGRLVAEEDALFSVFDYGFLYGDGVCEEMRCHEGKVFRLDKHLKDSTNQQKRFVWIFLFHWKNFKNFIWRRFDETTF